MKRLSKISALVLAPLFLITNLVLADDAKPEQTHATGKATKTWLQLQASGSQAAPSPQQTGDAASRIYQRYLKSFEQPIPESFFEKQQGFLSQ